MQLYILLSSDHSILQLYVIYNDHFDLKVYIVSSDHCIL